MKRNDSDDLADQLLGSQDPSKFPRGEGKGASSTNSGARILDSLENLVSLLTTQFSSSSISGAGSSTGALPVVEAASEPPAMDVDSSGGDLNVGLPKIIKTQLLEQFESWKSEHEKFLRNSTKIESIKKSIESLAAGTYPPNFPRFKCGFECIELDKQCSEFVVDSVHGRFQFKNGTSYRDAKEALHREHLILNLKLDLLVSEERAENFEAALQWKSFLNRAVQVANGTISNDAKFGTPALALDRHEVEKFLKVQYSKYMVSLKTKELKEATAADKLRIERDSLEEKVANLDPAEFIGMKIKQAFSMAKNQRPLESQNLRVNFAGETPKVEEKPKNGEALSGGQGSSPKKPPKQTPQNGKGKTKTKGDPKGKSKGGPGSNTSSKGKGKGQKKSTNK